MSYDKAIGTIQEWIDITYEVVADHGRAGKFQIRTDKLLRNALRSYEVNCTAPYDAERIGKNDFAIWEKQAVRSEDHCTQTETIKAGLYAWVDNYACMSKKTSRQTKRVTKFIGKMTNPYC
ncbi:Oidioi.mRNA.OKI2018_I69.chr1.g3733.t1.cds [Oikopleura dioica]|uniref:Oidioi.mRNA.OKI2018_I69.chr1.g3733.t1.cds n=1 Tax=Oikopleura dioica TaxID=34765 RepID=A0ABN7SUZ7_OIKDI|nr:Oidioi.mRNA.OKI2018_I69.chr1.g3733.t1.cds [Oikopleura dioica]